MRSDELTPHERSILAGYRLQEPRPSPDAQAQTWAAIAARTRRSDEAGAQPRAQTARPRPPAPPRPPARAWAIGLAMAAGLLLGWGLAQWPRQVLSRSTAEPSRDEAAYEAAKAQGRQLAVGVPESRPRSSRATEAPPALGLEAPPPPAPSSLESAARPELGLEAPASSPPAPSSLEPAARPELGLEAPASSPPSSPESAARRARHPPPAGRSSPAPNLSATELQQLEDARRMAVRGDPERAVHLLQAHRRRYPNSLLAEERAIAEVQALCRKGDRTAAQRRVERFIQRRKSSHLVATMRRACPDAPGAANVPHSGQ